MMRFLLILTVAITTAACWNSSGSHAFSPTEQAFHKGPSSKDGEEVGRWLLAELLAPGGTAQGAAKARAKLEKSGHQGMIGSFAVALDDTSHGRLKEAAKGYVQTLQASRVSADPLAPLISWFATNHLLSLSASFPELGASLQSSMEQMLDEPGSIGWRARGELVEWWSRTVLQRAEATDVLERTAMRYGCAKNIRLAGPFGHGAPSDRRRSFGAESPGPWPAEWQPDPERNQVPHILKTERHGCVVRADEPVQGGVYYAETYLDTTGARDLILAAQGALAVWVDDSKVLTRDMRVWGVWPKFGVHVQLEPGRHRVLVRLEGPEASIRILRPDGVQADIETSLVAAMPYGRSMPKVLDERNILARYLQKGQAQAPRDELEAYLASYLAGVEGQFDIASVLLEPLLIDQSRASAIALASAASYAEKDPIFPENDARDVARLFRQKAIAKDSALWWPKLWLIMDNADKGMPEAVRALRSMATEFPDAPDILRVLLSLYGKLGWKAERAQAARDLVTRFPMDRAALEAAIPIEEETGKRKEADELAARLHSLYPDSEIELDRSLSRHDYQTAIAELKGLAKRRPDRKELADRLMDLLARAGQNVDPIDALERALRKNPHDANARLTLADVHFAHGDLSALRTALAQAIQQGAGPEELRNAIDMVEGMTELEPFRKDGRAVIHAYEAAGSPATSMTPSSAPQSGQITAMRSEGTAARVLDYSALWVHRDGSARMLEHEIIQVQSQEAIGKLSEQHVPNGALVLRMRVLKKDGTVLEPERVEAKPTLTMPHLEVGDYIETETITPTPGDGEGGRRYVSPQWFFREADIAYWRSEFVVISPHDRPLTVESHGAVPLPQITEQEGALVIHRWRVDQSPPAPVEPASVPIQEFLPSVRVGWGLTLEGQLQRMLEASGDELPHDPRLIRIAERIVADAPALQSQERARRLYRWVLANVEEGREMDGRKVILGKSGSRAAGFLYLARALDLPIEIAVVRDRLMPTDAGPISNVLSFSNLVLRLERASPSIVSGPIRKRAVTTKSVSSNEKKPSVLWFTVGDKYAPFGFLPAELRGQPVVRLIAGLPRETTSAQGIFDGIVYEGTVEMHPDGSALFHLNQRFVGRLAMGVRGSLDQIPESQLKTAIESKLLARALPGARLAKISVEDREDLDKPLTLRMELEVSNFARRRGDTLVFRAPLMLQIANMAALVTRQTPLLLPEGTHSEVRLDIQLPKGASLEGPLLSTQVRDGDRMLIVHDGLKPDALHIERVLDIPSDRIPVEAYPRFRAFTLSADEANGREIRVKLRQ